MHFSTPLLTLLAIAAGVQAAKQSEPPIFSKSVSVQGTAASTGTHPIVTGGGGGTNGTSGTNATSTGGGGAASSSGAAGAAGSASSSGAAGSGVAATGASNTPASPSSTGFVPSNPGAKVSVPMVGAGLGSIAYGALIFLA